jgi:hypothetical protein
VRKLFSGEPDGRKLTVPAAKVKVTVAKPTVPSSSSAKQHKKTVRIVLLLTKTDLLNCCSSITGLSAVTALHSMEGSFGNMQYALVKLVC